MLDIIWSQEAELVCQRCLSKIPQARGFTNRYLFSHSSGGWKSEIKVSAGLVSPWLVNGRLLYESIPRIFSSSYENTDSIRLVHTLTALFS